jgi:hypothetical protein
VSRELLLRADHVIEWPLMAHSVVSLHRTNRQQLGVSGPIADIAKSTRLTRTGSREVLDSYCFGKLKRGLLS